VLLTGTAALGGTLGAFVGFDPDGEVLAGSETYQWLFDGNTILGATNANYVVQAGDVGHNISVRVTYVDGQGNLNNGLSGNLAPAVSDPIFIGTLGVTGVTGINTPTMTADSTIVDPDGGPVAPEYVWETSLNGTTNWTVASAGVSADTATFSPTGTTTAAGAFVRVRMTYVDDGSNLEEIQGTAMHYIINGNGNSTLVGTAAADLIWGQGGNDQITAGGGNDFVQGGSNGDTFFATLNDGDDIYDGGTGNDTYVMTATSAAANVDLAAGTASSAQTGSDQLISIENVTGSAGDNVIIGSAGSNELNGNGGNDFITGLAGGDRIDGGTGNDTFFFTIGDGNNDDYIGGTGSDTIDLSGITGSTTLNLNTGNTSGAQIGNDTLSGIENIIGGAGNDTITGSTQANVFRGGAGTDSISAGNGNDTFVAVAGDGNDTYNGQGGTDTLDMTAITTATTVRLDTGSASGVSIGTDTISNIERIIGGSGIDTITAGNAPETFTGNGGADIFQFRSAGAAGNGLGNRAVITDFTHGVDKIDLSFLDAFQGSAGTQHFTFGGIISGATTAGLQQVAIRHLIIAGEDHTLIEGNIRGFGGNTDFQIDLLGNIAIDANDFLFGP
jgi:Ca2+-binding RTX toxin-like protein